MIKYFFLVGLGGGAGSMLRYAVQKLFPPHSLQAFPAGTFIVNIAGCFLIGIFWGLLSRSMQWSEDIKLVLMTGFCGGFTTFSAFTLESIGLMKENKTWLLFLYIAGSVIFGLLATVAGMRLVK